MKEIVSKSEKLKEFKQRAEALGRTVDLEAEKRVGSNGYNIGQTFTLDGSLKIAEVRRGTEVTGVFLALGTKEGVDLSLQSLMGLSSLRGYELTGEADDSTGNHYDAEVAPDVKKDFIGWKNLKTRDLYEMAALIESGDIKVADKKVTYKGRVFRKWVARTAGTDLTTNQAYAEGDQRVSRVQLWHVAI